MNTLINIYETLRSHGICSSQSDFSQRFLGRSASYLAHLRSSGTDCCPVSLNLLAERLQRRADELLHPTPHVADLAAIRVLRSLHADLVDTIGEA